MRLTKKDEELARSYTRGYDQTVNQHQEIYQLLLAEIDALREELKQSRADHLICAKILHAEFERDDDIPLRP